MNAFNISAKYIINKMIIYAVLSFYWIKLYIRIHIFIQFKNFNRNILKLINYFIMNECFKC